MNFLEITKGMNVCTCNISITHARLSDIKLHVRPKIYEV